MPVTLTVEYDGADDLAADYSDNLSSGKVFLCTDRQLEAGTAVKLKISFPGLLQPIVVSGIVRWTRDDGQDGAGIVFDDDSLAHLEGLVQRVRDRDPAVVRRLVRILVVEDNPHVAQLIRNGLHGTGKRNFRNELAFNFRTATNGRDALHILASESFDILIIDVYLPILDGAHVIAQVRADDDLRQIPIIAVSAGGKSAREAAMAAGADSFVEKPMRLSQIIDSMCRLIDL